MTYIRFKQFRLDYYGNPVAAGRVTMKYFFKRKNKNMKNIIAIAVTIAVVTSAQFANAVPTATYDPATGNISWSDIGDPTVVLLLISEGGNLLNGNDFGGGVDNGDVPNAITWFSLPPIAVDGALPAGNIVNPGTDIGDLSVQFFESLTGGSAPGEVRAIPEPGSIALASMGLIGLVALRRRRTA